MDPYTAAKERGNALLEHLCPGVQGGEVDADHPAFPPPHDPWHGPSFLEQPAHSRPPPPHGWHATPPALTPHQHLVGQARHQQEALWRLPLALASCSQTRAWLVLAQGGVEQRPPLIPSGQFCRRQVQQGRGQAGLQSAPVLLGSPDAPLGSLAAEPPRGQPRGDLTPSTRGGRPRHEVAAPLAHSAAMADRGHDLITPRPQPMAYGSRAKAAVEPDAHPLPHRWRSAQLPLHRDPGRLQRRDGPSLAAEQRVVEALPGDTRAESPRVPPRLALCRPRPQGSTTTATTSPGCRLDPDAPPSPASLGALALPQRMPWGVPGPTNILEITGYVART
jgi:hypothetical protein